MHDYQTLAPVIFGLLLFLFVLAILWFFLPFAIFGTKPKLDELIAEQKKTNKLLSKLTKTEATPSTEKADWQH